MKDSHKCYIRGERLNEIVMKQYREEWPITRHVNEYLEAAKRLFYLQYPSLTPE